MSAPAAKPPVPIGPKTVPVTGGVKPPVIARGLDSYIARHKDKLDVKPSQWDEPSSLIVMVTGEKGVGKTTIPYGIPRPNGGKVAWITFDQATKPSLLKRFKKEDLKHVLLYEVTKPIRDDKGVITSSGFESSDLISGEVVFARAYKILQDLKGADDIDNVVLDMCSAYWDGPGKNMAYAKAGADPMSTIQYGEWGPRSTALKGLDHAARQVAKYATIFTGYGERSVETMIKDDNGKNTVGMAVKSPSWVKPLREDVTLWLDAWRVQTQTSPAQFKWGVNVVDSRIDGFDIGQQFDLTGKLISEYWPKT